MTKIAAYHLNSLSRRQPAAHPLTAPSLSWEPAHSLLFWRMMFDLIQAFTVLPSTPVTAESHLLDHNHLRLTQTLWS